MKKDGEIGRIYVQKSIGKLFKKGSFNSGFFEEEILYRVDGGENQSELCVPASFSAKAPSTTYYLKNEICVISVRFGKPQLILSFMTILSPLRRSFSENDLCIHKHKALQNDSYPLKKAVSYDSLHFMSLVKGQTESSSSESLIGRVSSPKFLSLKEVFQKIKPLLCKIVLLFNEEELDGSVREEGTGFFINNSGLLATSFSFFKSQIIVSQSLFSASLDDPVVDSVDPGYLRVKFRGETYRVSLKVECSQKVSLERNLCLLQIEVKDNKPFDLGMNTDDLFQILADPQLEEGEEVYFGGFPLTQKIPTFHKGSISSVSENKGIHHFTIDGTVVGGNTGSPVFMQKDGKLQLIGIIESGISDLHPQFQITQSFLGQLQSHEKVFCKIDEEDIPLGTAQSLYTLFSAIHSNMSTGMGKAVSAYHLSDLSRATPVQEEIKNETPQKEVVTKVQVEDVLKAHNWKFLYTSGENDIWENQDPHIQFQLPIPSLGRDYKAVLQVVEHEISVFFKKKLEVLLRELSWRFLTCKDSEDVWGYEHDKKILGTVKFPSNPASINDKLIREVIYQAGTQIASIHAVFRISREAK